MVIKIQPPSKDIENALRYNERKMTTGAAVMTREQAQAYLDGDNAGHVLATRNVPEGSGLLDEFIRLHSLNMRTRRNGRAMRNETFHMSINPGADDRPLTEAEALSLADAVMEALGYGACPYRVYRHDDTGRTHYHVVGTRIGQDGRKVDSDFEHMRCRNIAMGLASEYGYTYGLGEEKERKEETAAEAGQLTETLTAAGGKKGKRETEKTEKKKTFVKPFMRTSRIPVTEQMRTFHSETLQWRYSTIAEYAAIMRRRFMAETAVCDDGLHFQGVGRDGRTVTRPITEGELGIGALDEALERALSCDMAECRDQRRRLEKVLAEAAGKADSWESFKRLAGEKGVYTVIAWSSDDRPFGVTWLDRATRCAFKGSETDCDMGWLQGLCQEKGWTITRDQVHEARPGGKRRPRATATAREATSPYRYADREGTRQLAASRGAYRTHGDNSSAAHNRGELEDDVRKTGVKI